MAAFNRGTEATYEVHETIRVDTQDNSDHTFCGVMFPIKCKAVLPLDHVVIRSVAVRGQLGPLTVWVSNEKKPNGSINNNHTNDNSNNTNNNRNRNSRNRSTSFRLVQKDWTKVYERNHEPSMTQYKDLELDPPIIMQPGEVRAIYIHSKLPGDEAIVYDNAYYYLPRIGGQYHDRHYARKPRYDDAMISVFTGRAHVSNHPFGHRPIWGWGNAWRDQREFVGRLEYGAVYKLWHPEKETRLQFGPKFSNHSILLLMCQRRWESPISMLPDECIFYILHMCRWDWFNDTQEDMKRCQFVRKKKARENAAVITAAAAASVAAVAQQNLNHQDNGDTGNASVAGTTTTNNDNICNNRNCNKSTRDAAVTATATDVSMQVVDMEQMTNSAVAAAFDDELNSNMDEDEDEDYNDDDGDDDDDIEFIDGDNDDVDFDFEEEYDDGDEVVEVDNDNDDGMFIADHQIFRFVDFDDEDDENSNNTNDQNQNNNDGSEQNEANFIREALFHRQFARIHILRALAAQGEES